MEAKFHLGRKFAETTIDDRSVEAVFDLAIETADNKDQDNALETNGDVRDAQSSFHANNHKSMSDVKLVQTQVDSKGRTSKITRTTYKGPKENEILMNVIMVANGVESTAVFKKIQ